MKLKFLLILFTLNLFAEHELGCNAIIANKQAVGCSASNILMESSSIEPLSILEEKISLDQNHTTAISEKLDFVEVYVGDKKLKIERDNLNDLNTCPPFCIEPMTIDKVKTVGELETLAFINKLKEKKARLLIDVRESKVYQEASIPGAINLPENMLEDNSKYQKEVLKLLGATKTSKKSKYKWIFKNPQTLLIFGNAMSSHEASKSIKKLLALGYPSSKLLYYRGGMRAWKSLGLTSYSSK